MLNQQPVKFGLVSLVAGLAMVALISARPDAAAGLLADRALGVHLVLELIAIVIATQIVAVSWYTFDLQRDDNANAMLTGFVVVIGCDLMHALTYAGMPPLLVESGTPQGIFYWLMGRSFEAMTLGAVTAGLVLRWSRMALLSLGLAVVAATIVFGTFALDLFPTTFVPGVGLTPFKTTYEYVLIGINGLLSLLLWRQAMREQSSKHLLLSLSCLFMALGGFAFASYAAPSDLQNMLGHLYKVTAYALLYRATFIASIRAPFEALRSSEAEVRESNARVHMLGANLPNSVLYQVISDVDGRRQFTEMSDSVERVCGLKAADVLRNPLTLYGCIHPDDVCSFAAAEQNCIDAMLVFDRETRFCHPDGSLRRLHCVSAPRLLEDGRTVWDGLLTDITERAEAQETRRKLEHQLGEAQKMESIGTLASGIAHDFNNVLAAIQGNAHMAKEDLKSGIQADVLLSLDQIIKASNRAKSLVDRILSFSRRDGTRRQAQRLLPVVHDSMSLLRSTLPAGVQLLERIENAEACAEIDRTQFEQVLLNLCTNAWHALGEQGGHIEVSLGTVQLDAAASLPLGLMPGHHVRISVQDNGSGMSDQTLQRIFEPFFTTKPVGKGTGLGLSVVHGIVRAHDGTIDVQTQPGQGTRFSVLIPALFQSTASEATTTGTELFEDESGHGERILLVEDDLLLATMMEKLLVRRGFCVQHFADPELAIAAMRADPNGFDVLVSDYNMPKKSGIEVIVAAREARPNLPSILISGYMSDELRALAAARGVHHVLNKASALDELVQLLLDALDLAHAEMSRV